MGTSYHVYGFKPPDARWLEMKKVYEACEAAGVPVPREVEKFFNFSAPTDNGVEVSQGELEACGAVVETNGEDDWGFLVDVTKLPKDVTKVKFYISV